MFKKIASICLLLTITACSTSTVTPVPEQEGTVSSMREEVKESSSSIAPKAETRTGVIKPIGITIYMQGTHKLEQTDSSELLLLESTSVDLNGYVNETVQITGLISSTIEANGLIMNVDSIQLIEISSSSSLADTESFSSAEDQTSTIPTQAQPSSVSTSASEIDTNSSTSSEAVSQSSFAKNAINTEVITEFTTYDYAPANWTQNYCSRLAPFCLKFHKNWWYQSFGATTNELNRLEISNKEVAKIGDGVIIVRLLAGTTSLNGQVQVASGIVTAYHTLDANRYFIVEGPVELQTAITYLANTITLSE